MFNIRSRQPCEGGAPYPLRDTSDNDPMSALPRLPAPETLTRRELLELIRCDIYSDICGPFPYSSLNYFWVTARMMSLFMMFEQQLKNVNNPLYHDIYVANRGRSSEKRLFLAVAALSERDEECLRIMAKVMEEQRMGWMQHIYWDDLDSSMDGLRRHRDDAEEPDLNMCNVK